MFLDAMVAAILEHSEDGYVIILFFGYLFLTCSNTQFEAHFLSIFFHYGFVEHVLRRTTSCRAHI